MMHVKTYGCAMCDCWGRSSQVSYRTEFIKGSHQIISGLPDAAVKENLARLESAIHKSSYRMPDSNITFNLGPADVKYLILFRTSEGNCFVWRTQTDSQSGMGAVISDFPK